MIIRVPATSANLGPGFDCMGIAFALYNTFIIEPAAEFSQEDLIIKSMRALWREAGVREVPVCVRQSAHVPRARGLGSSATCIVAGLMAANRLAGDPLNRDDLVALAARLEGHPDNVLPAMLGGMVVGAMEGGHVTALPLPVPDGLLFRAFIPGKELPTQVARALVPDSFSRQACVFTLSRAALLAGAMATGNIDLLGEATRDVLHQPYRTGHIPGWQQVARLAKDHGALAVTLSGAGPTMLGWWKAKMPEDGMWRQALIGIPGQWRSLALEVDHTGACFL
nr:homoserine kinase [bacterium]